MMVIQINLFVHDGSLTSKRFTTRTEQLNVVPRRFFYCGSNCLVFWSRVFVLFEPDVRFHIFSSVRVTE